jgi:hypothetical protein
VSISPTGSGPSLGPIDAAALYAARNPSPLPPGTTTPPPGGGPAGGGGSNGLTVSVPSGARAAALGTRGGLRVIVTTTAAGVVKVTATVPASRLGRKGKKPVVIATGKATATKAGKVTVTLKATKAARKKLKRLRGAKVKLTVKVGQLTSTKTVTLK